MESAHTSEKNQNTQAFEMRPVASSNIHSVGYLDGRMRLRFANGKVYEYTGPKVKEHYEAFMKAESKGRYFTQNIRHCKDTKCVPWVEPKTDA